MEAIKFEKVRFSYANAADTAADEDIFSSDAGFSLNEIDFSVQEGEFVAVLGHNGSGKSTLARLTNGLLTPDSGKITVMGLDASEQKNLFNIRKQVGIVFQNPDNQTVASIVEDDVAFGPENVGVPREEIGARIDFALNAVGMSEYRRTSVAHLSGGQKQRVAIAGVLALKPRVIILDESTAMLDPRGRKEVVDVVLRLNKEEKITVLMITHFPEEALLADRAVVMSHGDIVMQGKPEEILGKCELEKYSLAAPRSVELCKALRAGGLDVPDSFDTERLADSIVSALAQTPVTLPSFADEENETSPTTENDDESGKVECKNLSYTYQPSSPDAAHALCGVDLEIQTGDFFGIIGHTGSGKSTFVQHLNALIKLPTAEKKYKEKRGKPRPDTVLKVGGFDLTKKDTDFKALRKRVGMVFQYPEYQLFADTVYQDVAFGLRNFENEMTSDEIKAAVKAAIEIVGLDYEQIKNRSPFELSGGQKRRVAIAGVLVTKPEILVLDEPAAGLDPLGKREIAALLHKLHGEWCKTVVIVSHDMDEIAENCTRAAIFLHGKVLRVGAPRELFQGDVVKEAGLDTPIVAKLVESLRARGLELDCDCTAKDFVDKILQKTKTGRAGTRLPKGGQDGA